MAEAIMSILSQEMDNYKQPSKVKLISEPGSYLSSSCMTVLCKVIGKKSSRNTKTVGYFIFDFIIFSYVKITSINFNTLVMFLLNPRFIILENVTLFLMFLLNPHLTFTYTGECFPFVKFKLPLNSFLIF